MTLKAKLKTLDGLPDVIKAEYRPESDFFVLDTEAVDGWNVEDVNGLKNALSTKTTELRQATTKLNAFKVDGVDLDPTEAVTAIQKVKEFASIDPKEMAKEQVKAALQQQQDQFNKQIEMKDSEVKSLTTHLETVMIDNAATQALAAKGGNIKLLLPHVKSSVKLVKGENGFNVEVVDHNGNPRIHVASGKTSNMTLEQLIDEMSAAEDYGSAFNSPAKSGGGSQNLNNNNNPGRARVLDPNDQNSLNSSIEDIASGKAQVSLQ